MFNPCNLKSSHHLIFGRTSVADDSFGWQGFKCLKKERLARVKDGQSIQRKSRKHLLAKLATAVL